jgi:orotidine-5'-phosphate decarboxylase
MPLLVPGVGAQGGDLAAAVAAATDARGAGALISASRAVIYASDGADYLDAAVAAARQLRDQINAVRHAQWYNAAKPQL